MSQTAQSTQPIMPKTWTEWEIKDHLLYNREWISKALLALSKNSYRGVQTRDLAEFQGSVQSILSFNPESSPYDFPLGDRQLSRLRKKLVKKYLSLLTRMANS